MTFEKILLAMETVGRLVQHRFPAGQQKTAYTLNKIRKMLVAEHEFFQQQRKSLIEELGTSRRATPYELAEGATPMVWEVKQDSPNWPEFSIRIKELLTINVDVADIKISLDDLESIDLSARDIEALEPFLTSEEVEKVSEEIV